LSSLTDRWLSGCVASSVVLAGTVHPSRAVQESARNCNALAAAAGVMYLRLSIFHMPDVFECMTDELPLAQQKDFLCEHALRHSYAAKAQHSSNT